MSFLNYLPWALVLVDIAQWLKMGIRGYVFTGLSMHSRMSLVITRPILKGISR